MEIGDIVVFRDGTYGFLAESRGPYAIIKWKLNEWESYTRLFEDDHDLVLISDIFQEDNNA